MKGEVASFNFTIDICYIDVVFSLPIFGFHLICVDSLELSEYNTHMAKGLNIV